MKTEQRKAKQRGNIKFQIFLGNKKTTILNYRRVMKEPNDLNNGQATKGARGMPWHQEPMKDAAICDKLRGGESSHRSVDFRMGKPDRAILYQRALNT